MPESPIRFDKSKFKKWLGNPFGNALLQILLYLLFAFGPFLLFSLRHSTAEGVEKSAFELLPTWFANGELAYFCIAIVGLTIFNSFMRFAALWQAMGFTILAIILGFAAIIFAPDVFIPQNYPPEKLKVIFIMYVLSVTLWFLSMLGSKGKGAFIGLNSKKRADRILEKANP